MTRLYHLAQINIGRVLAPIDSPQLADFVANLEPINALADGSSGFVWRLQTEDGDATAVRPFDDDQIMINMSVWESVEALGAFVFRSGHTAVMKRRREWFEKSAEAYVCLWWVPAGHVPTVEEAKERLEYLRQHGPTAHAFTFKALFEPGSETSKSEQPDNQEWFCPA